MKKALLALMCMAAMMATSTSLKAQEVIITLSSGWTWISYPSTDTLDFATAFGSFTPMAGDIIKSKWGSATYINGQWRGTASQFYPGYGFHYYSNRTETVTLTFQIQQSISQVMVITSEPTDITAASVVVGGTVTLPEGSHIFLSGVCWGTSQMPTVDDNHTSDGSGTNDFTTSLIGLASNTTYYVRAYVVTDYGLAYGDEQSFTTLDGGSSGDHEYVDLGLPSGLLWATCNVGANNSEDYGDYFAWGETQPKDIYNWSTYQYCNGSYNTLTKYCSKSSYGYNGFTDNLTTLLPEDDAATVIWGDDWRIPTKDEWQELYNNTTFTWTTQNGVNGRLFTASNGNSLFLPAAGCFNGSTLYNASIGGYYGSSSLCTSFAGCAWDFYFGSLKPGFGTVGKDVYNYVRPVFAY